jgi:hypothetical protein
VRRVVPKVLPALLLALPAAGCGNSRTLLPALTRPAAPSVLRTVVFPRQGIQLSIPRNWPVVNERAPLLAVASSGPAVIAVWRFPGGAIAPASAAGLTQTRDALIAAARTRQPGLRLIRSAVVSVDGHGAVELDSLQRLRGQARRVRSMHVYLPGAELVLEEYAPPSLFHQVDHSVFSPVKRSLRLLAKGT